MNKLWNLVKDKSVIVVGPSPHLKEKSWVVS